MTRKQIAEALDLHYDYINKAFQKAEEEHPELGFKDHTMNTSIGDGKDYPLDMVLLGLSYLRNGQGISDLEKAIIEIHFIDFNQNIYGQYIYFEFVDYMRDNIKFNSVDELVAQIKKDRIKAKKALQ